MDSWPYFMENLHSAAVLPEAAKCTQVFQCKIESSASYEAWCSPSTVLALNLQLLAKLPDCSRDDALLHAVFLESIRYFALS